MEAKELRIRNLVLYAGMYLYVSAINRHGEVTLSSLIDETCTDIKNCKPIPLTEEWLLKFGFIPCIGRISVFEINLRDISNYKALIFYMTNGQVDIDSTQLTYIKYVHQLQNLYFALKHEELEVKL